MTRAGAQCVQQRYGCSYSYLLVVLSSLLSLLVLEVVVSPLLCGWCLRPSLFCSGPNRVCNMPPQNQTIDFLNFARDPSYSIPELATGFHNAGILKHRALEPVGSPPSPRPALEGWLLQPGTTCSCSGSGEKSPRNNNL